MFYTPPVLKWILIKGIIMSGYYVQVDTNDNNKICAFAPYEAADRGLLNDAPNNKEVRPDSDTPIPGDPPADLIVMAPGEADVCAYRYNDTTDQVEAI